MAELFSNQFLLLNDDLRGFLIDGIEFSFWSTWRERFRRPIRSANLFAMSLNLPASRHGRQGRARILSVVYDPFEWPIMSGSSCNDDVTISCFLLLRRGVVEACTAPPALSKFL